MSENLGQARPGAGGIAMALASAALFGLTPVLAKPLLPGMNLFLASGLMYAGAGALMALYSVQARLSGRSREKPLRGKDLPWLTLAVFCGGIAGPVLLMFGLARVGAAETALLLNLAGLATMLIAWLAFRENVDARLFLGAMAILGGAVVPSWTDGFAFQPGVLFIAAACLMWGVDNNVTRKIADADPVQITMIKGLVAGGVNSGIGLALSGTAPEWTAVLSIAAIGATGVGVSLVLFIHALRHLGTARTGAYFSTAPFIGAVAAVLFTSEPLTAALAIAATLMLAGLWLHLTENHDHAHSHEAMEHEHLHTHDAHHRHTHEDGDPVGEGPHSHFHVHAAMRHKHPHFPDTHHRHAH